MTVRHGYKQTYTHRDYSRPRMILRDRVAEKFSAHSCEICGKALERKNTAKGQPESWTTYNKRRTCGKIFDGIKWVPTKCYHEWRSNPVNNPNYKGLMHRACIDCGKQGLSYVSQDEKLPQRCRPCAEKIAGGHNKKETPLFKCSKCGKDIIGRWNGQMRYPRNGKTFCSNHCANTTRNLKRVDFECIVCHKIVSLQPNRAKIRKTCSLSCNGKLNKKSI